MNTYQLYLMGLIMTLENNLLRKNQLRFISGVYRSRLQGDEKWVIDYAMLDHITTFATGEAITFALTQENRKYAYKIRYNEILDELAPAETTVCRSGEPLRRL